MSFGHPRCRRLGTLGLTLLSLVAATASRAQDAPAAAGPVRGLQLVATETGRVDWAPRGDWISFDRVDADGYSRLYVARPDGSNSRCLTCQPLDFRKRHAGNPTWHPSGGYLVFEVEKPFRKAGLPEPFLTVPGRNRGNDLWAISFDGRAFFNLTSFGERGGGRAHSPRFSHEGDHLVWAEKVSGGGDWGRWVVRVAEVAERRGVPRLRRARTHKLGPEHGYHEPYGFTADDRGVLLAADRPPAGPEAGTDLYLLRLEGGEFTRLTGGNGRWHRFARLAPNGRWIVWGSDREIGGRRTGAGRAALDLWMMRADGSEPRRLTRFNDVFADSYSGPVAVSSAAWSPEGDRLLILVAPLAGSTSGNLYLLELDQAYGR